MCLPCGAVASWRDWSNAIWHSHLHLRRDCKARASEDSITYINDYYQHVKN